MSEQQGITADEVREIAAGAIAGWAPGWTGDDGVNPQRRVRVAGFGDGYVDLRVEGAPGTGEPDREFRVMLTVVELVTEEAAVRALEEVREAGEERARRGIPWQVTVHDGECGLPGPCTAHGNYACDEIKPGPPGHSFRHRSQPPRPYIAPVETGEPFRSAVQAEWDDSYGPE